jgi:hypothetical protein
MKGDRVMKSFEHYDEFSKHFNKAMELLRKAVACSVWDSEQHLYFNNYKEEMKIANKHFGIFKRMRNRELDKLSAE